MSEFGLQRLSDDELEAEFALLFPHGFGGADVALELAPQGWESSPLLPINHPTVDQVYAETCQIHANIAALRRPDDLRPSLPELTREEVAGDFRETPIDIDREVRELVGKCLWDIFSDGHDVVASDGRRLDLGSFRASGGFLADVLNRQIGACEYDYIDFYMGTCWLAGRADLKTVYQMIFRRLRARGLDWTYHFPRLYAVDLRPLKEALDQKDNPDWEQYDPSAALSQQAEEREHAEKLAQLRQTLDESQQEAVVQARKSPPPATVLAYEAVYGRYPDGWPPGV
jgi:hypothetical protein